VTIDYATIGTFRAPERTVWPCLLPRTDLINDWLSDPRLSAKLGREAESFWAALLGLPSGRIVDSHALFPTELRSTSDLPALPRVNGLLRGRLLPGPDRQLLIELEFAAHAAGYRWPCAAGSPMEHDPDSHHVQLLNLAEALARPALPGVSRPLEITSVMPSVHVLKFTWTLSQDMLVPSMNLHMNTALAARAA
jgi:hypothetical protein